MILLLIINSYRNTIKFIIYGDCNQQPNEKKVRAALSLEWEKLGLDFVTLVAQPDSAARSDLGAVWILDEREEIKKRNAILNFGMIMSIP